jgi:hypothetical protein
MSVIEFPYNDGRRGHSRKPICDNAVLERKPKPIMPTPCDGEDLIFAVIEHHRALSVRYDAAIKQHSAVEYGPLEDAAGEIVDEACDDLLDFCDDRLMRAEPATLIGLVAFLEYIRTLEEWETPRGDVLCYNKERPSGWFCELCRTLENAITRIDARNETPAPIT